jgi:hypothetical protein
MRPLACNLLEGRYLFARLRTMRTGIGSLVVAPQVLQDVVFAADWIEAFGDKHRDRVRPRRTLKLIPLCGVGRNLARPEVETELGQPLPYLVGVRTPLRLVELHAPLVALRRRA